MARAARAFRWSSVVADMEECSSRAIGLIHDPAGERLPQLLLRDGDSIIQNAIASALVSAEAADQIPRKGNGNARRQASSGLYADRALSRTTSTTPSLPDGTVLLLASDGQAYHGQIGPDGRFTIPEVPRGEARVAVTSLAEGPHSGGGIGGGGASRVGVQAPMQSRIPMHYGDFAQSGLTATIADDTALNLDLK